MKRLNRREGLVLLGSVKKWRKLVEGKWCFLGMLNKVKKRKKLIGKVVERKIIIKWNKKKVEWKKGDEEIGEVERGKKRIDNRIKGRVGKERKVEDEMKIERGGKKKKKLIIEGRKRNGKWKEDNIIIEGLKEMLILRIVKSVDLKWYEKEREVEMIGERDFIIVRW